MAKGLTDRQKEIFNYIHERVEGGFPPTVREVGNRFGFSEKAAHDHLNALAKKGYITREDGKPRAIKIKIGTPPSVKVADVLRSKEAYSALEESMAENQRGIVEIPVYGHVQAGTPLMAYENIEGTLPIPTRLVGDDECFALRIIGSSMVGAGILEDDFVIVKSQPNAEPGDIVVALVEDEATVKRLFIEGDKIRLQPENPDFKPSIVDAENVLIIGKVVGVHRKI